MSESIEGDGGGTECKVASLCVFGHGKSIKLKVCVDTRKTTTII